MILIMEDSGIDSDPKTSNRVEDDNALAASDSSCGSGNNQPAAPRSTTKQLQRKLEARIEQARRIQRGSEYTKLPDNEPDGSAAASSTPAAATANAALIPIQRLPIPQRKRRHSALIEFWRSDSESEDEMTLFATRDGNFRHKQDLTDTFSVEELSEGSEDSLHLGSSQSDLHPHTNTYMPSGCFSCQCRIL
ncbi:uncharacterized protein LOC131666974 [Phymastichus coffea]|uniref:uncharacterized protein LOC131666974 n=1 Tax=Phymastichus coffea TaxID=108790 RepID=UPI00273BDD22|nr:uncharacterized protein LOC131666974 [Phymastichus coffea]